MRPLGLSDVIVAALATTSVVGWGCATGDEDGDRSEAAVSRGAMVECKDSVHKNFDEGRYGVLPANALLPNGMAPKDMTPELLEGRCTWIQDTAGSERLYR